MSSKDKRPTPTRGPVATAEGGAVSKGNPSSPPANTAEASGDVQDFITRMKTLAPSAAGQRGRLVFAMDATMSRQPTWDMALSLQADMFTVVKDVGGLDVQLVFFRGMNECRSSRWVSDPAELARLMTTVSCRGGITQLARVMTHAAEETAKRRINAVVFVGDAMEEDIDYVCSKAGALGLLGVPVFLFQEGANPDATRAYKEIARLTKGATCRFDAGSAEQLRALLRAVAVYASGGRKALLALSTRSGEKGAQLLLGQMKQGD
ncbi:MAG: VWA domain-containing protein [Rhodoplanes sp.]